MIEIRHAPMVDLDQYEQISIARTVTAHLDRESLKEGLLTTHPVTPYVKDYDACEEDRPTILPTRFDTQNWATLIALQDHQRVGGAIPAWNCPRFDLLENRLDLTHIVDLRVAPEARAQGIGKALFQEAAKWAKDKNCTELRVETQDTNPEACRFYAAMGCRLHSVEANAYGPDIDELKLIWTLPLAP
jgi:GNAT superfamily N-acetyltransferase